MSRPHLLSIALLLVFSNILLAQRVSINADGSPPDASAILDINGTSGGLLIPRLSMSDRMDIQSPATGLLVFQMDSISGFYYFDGVEWSGISSQTGWKTDGNAGTTQDNFIGTTDNQPLRFRVHNIQAGMIDSSKFNTTFGFKSMYSNEVGKENTAIGFRAMLLNKEGSNNSALGSGALLSNISGINNTAVGKDALNSSVEGDENTVSGVEAMYFNLSGSQNTSSGVRSMYDNKTGANNSAFGWRSLYRNFIGSDNAALGSTALFSNNLGGRNTAIGSGALYYNEGGSLATAIGYHAMHYANDTNMIYVNYGVAVGYDALRGSLIPSQNIGNFNTAVGYQSQLSFSEGSRNTSVGHATLYTNNIGSDNTAIGHSALAENSSGNRNTAIGAQAFLTDTSFTNSTAIGYGAAIHGSNSIRLGDMDVTSIGGYADWTTVSDGRFKTNVKEDVVGIDFIALLRPVTYQLDLDAIADFHDTPDSLRNTESEQIKANLIQSGFIAQEVESAANTLQYDFSGVNKPSNPNDHYGLRYAQFVVPLVKAVQQQQDQIDVLTAQIQDLISENKQLNTSIKEMTDLKADVEALKMALLK